MVMVEIQSWVFIITLILLIYLAYDCLRLYKRNRELVLQLEDKG